MEFYQIPPESYENCPKAIIFKNKLVYYILKFI